MKRQTALACVVGLGFCLGGCASDEQALRRLGTAGPIVRTSLLAMGGPEAWRRIDRVEAAALVTLYNDAGTAHINRQDQTLDVRGRSIAARAREGEGAWSLKVGPRGPGVLKAEGFEADPAFRDRLTEALRTEMHRVRGPLNLLDARTRVLSTQRTRLDGAEVVRVDVVDPAGRKLAYGFDPATGLLRFLLEDRPGRKGTATLFTYQTLSGGLVFPRQIRLVHAGENVPVGAEPVMEIEFLRATVR